MLSKVLDIEWLKANHKMIHYFGLGFIQIKLNDEYRVHFYTDKLPSIMPEEDVHNHRYGFQSWILKGQLTQKLYEVTIGTDYIKEKESCKEGVEVDEPGDLVSIKCIDTKTFSVNEGYTISHLDFHKVIGKDCITLVSRGNIEKELAEVIRHVDNEKVCPFSKKIPESELWAIVEEMLNERIPISPSSP